MLYRNLFLFECENKDRFHTSTEECLLGLLSLALLVDVSSVIPFDQLSLVSVGKLSFQLEEKKYFNHI